MKIGDNISQEAYKKLIYFLLKDSPGQLSIDTARYYPHKNLACHIIGYIVWNTNNVKNADSEIRTFDPSWQTGKHGIELEADIPFHGIPGYELWQVDTLGIARTLLKSENPQHGTSLRLSINKILENTVEQALENDRRCVMGMDVRSSEILTMASKHSYDLHTLVPGISYDVYDKITSEVRWLDLTTQGTFPLSSVFKLVSSTALLESGKVLRMHSVSRIRAMEIGGRKFNCENHAWGIDITFRDAMARSWNINFYENAKTVKKERLIKTTVELGFSEKNGIELLYEANGLVPTEAWKKARRFGSWVLGNTVNLSIRQVDLLVTPLYICRLLHQ
jgi:penicillin-binding protein 2